MHPTHPPSLFGSLNVIVESGCGNSFDDEDEDHLLMMDDVSIMIDMHVYMCP
jgi:hypothetical protein